jgi:transposase-like protein
LKSLCFVNLAEVATYIGAKARNIHKYKRTGKTGMVGKTAVLGLLERGTEGTSRVRCKVVKRTRVSDIDPTIRANVEKGSEVITDSLGSYYKLTDEYVHQAIDHAVSYAEGHVHTNGLENFWSLLKRGIRGTYVNVEPFHLFRYLDEQAFRFNERKDNDAGRFIKAVSGNIGKGLRYAKLIGQEDGGSLPPPTTWQTV